MWYIYGITHYLIGLMNSDTMNGKCRILTFKITVFQVMGLCNLPGGYRIFSQDVLFPSFNGL